jgi:MFS family permease
MNHSPSIKDSWPPNARAWSLIALLVVAYATALVDRQLLTLLVEPVKRDLGITDTQFSLLVGLAFTLFYTLMGIPCGWLADRGSRRNLLIVSVLFWSVMTALCGLAHNFFTLFLARIGVGVGEAGLTPAAYSMIADSFAPQRRARPIGVFATGAILGGGLALVVGGAMVGWASKAPPVVLPVFGALKVWQLTFVLVSALGPVIALAFLFVREPLRHEAKETASAATLSLKQFLGQHGRLFALLAVGYSLINAAMAAYVTWTPALFTRVHGWSIARIGTVYGVVLLVFSSSGILIGGWLVDRLVSRGLRDAVLRVALAGCLAALPFALAAPYVPNGELAMALIAVMSFLFGLTQLPAAALQAIAPNRVRARIIALYVLCSNLIAYTLGPLGVALINDRLFGNPARIGQAIAILVALVAPVGALALFSARKGFLIVARQQASLDAQAP